MRQLGFLQIQKYNKNFFRYLERLYYAMLYNFFTKNGNLTFFPGPRAFSWGLALVPGVGLA